MSIFPQGGTPPQDTKNAVTDVNAVAACAILFYRLGCNPRFDPMSTNAIISEIVSVVNDLGLQYDCNSLDNLSRAIKNAINTGDFTNNYPLLAPDADDIIRGSYDGQEGAATVKSIAELAPSILDNIENMLDSDVVYIGRNGKGVRIPFSLFKAAFSSTTFGANYSWKNVYPAYFPSQIGVPQRNNRDVPIQINVMATRDNSNLFVSKDGVTWIKAGTGAGNSYEKNNISLIIPPQHFYRNDLGETEVWLELTPD